MWPLKTYPKISIANIAIKLLWVLTGSLECVYVKLQICFWRVCVGVGGMCVCDVLY